MKLRTAHKLYNFVNERLTDVDLGDKKPVFDRVTSLPCQSYKELLTAFEGKLYLTQNLKDTIAVMAATILSTHLDDRPLWFRIIGPPGSAKSTIADTFAAHHQYVFAVDFFTGFHSGKGEGEKDASLIPKMNNKCFVVSDADTINNSANKIKIISELRRIYDGSTKTHYLNDKQGTYNDLHVSALLCGTDDLRSLDSSFLGERFLDCEIYEDNEELEDTILSHVFSNARRVQDGDCEVAKGSDLKARTLGFIEHKLQHKPGPIPEGYKEHLLPLAKLVAHLRAKIKRDHKGHSVFRPRRETPTRLMSQLSNLCYCLRWVLGENHHKEVLRITTKIVSDTCKGYTRDVFDFVLRNDMCSIEEICEGTDIAKTTLRRYVDDLTELKLINLRKVPNNTGKRGRHKHVYSVRNTLQKMAGETSW